MINVYVNERLGVERCLECIRYAEQQRLVRLATGESREPAWKRILAWIRGGFDSQQPVRS